MSRIRGECRTMKHKDCIGCARHIQMGLATGLTKNNLMYPLTLLYAIIETIIMVPSLVPGLTRVHKAQISANTDDVVGVIVHRGCMDSKGVVQHHVTGLVACHKPLPVKGI